jgi:hypothetical protein
MAVAATGSSWLYGRACRPQDTVLYEAVRTELETFLSELERNGHRPLPRYVLNALRRYLRCGVLAHGFTRLHCEQCGHDVLVGFSCGQRSICPSCGVRRMDELGAQLVDRVLPDVPYRQFVLSLPWELRTLAARDPKVLTAVVRSLWQSLKERLVALSVRPDAEPGAITFVQRFGGSLNLNVHPHLVAPDGVFVPCGDDRVQFVPVSVSAQDIEHIVHSTRTRVLRWLETKGYLNEAAEELSNETAEPAALSACQQMALRYRGLSAVDGSANDVQPERRFEPRVGHRLHTRTEDGFDLDARVVIDRGDDVGRERLVRYCARPAVVLQRLSKLADGTYCYQTRYRRSGRTHRIMTGPELMARIAALVPPPHYPLVRYQGVFAGGHHMRRRVVPKPPLSRRKPCSTKPTEPPEPKTDTAASIDALRAELGELAEAPPIRSPFILSDPHMRRLLDGLLLMNSPRADWATLLRRSHDIDVLDCPKCHSRLRPMAVVRDEEQAKRFLQFIDDYDEPRPLSPARDPTFDDVA